MLVLSHRREGGAWVGDTISVQVLEIRGDKVRLGLRGNISFTRDELPEDVGIGRENGHLVLSRRLKEVIRVGDLGIIAVLEIRGKSVRLGYEFPREISIGRVDEFHFGDDAAA